MPQTWFERLFKFNQLNFSEGEIGLQVGPIPVADSVSCRNFIDRVYCHLYYNQYLYIQ